MTLKTVARRSTVVAALALVGHLALAAAPATLPLDSASGSGMYAMATGADGQVYLTWIDPLPDKLHALRFARLDTGAWTPPRTIATGNNWFVNWADHPSISALADGTLVAHWLVNNPGKSGSYGYGIRIARSTDRGETWREVFKAGLDNGSDYSGFVALLPEARGFSAVYLHPAAPAPAAPAGGHEVEHTKVLRLARFGADASLVSDTIVDPDVCTCCNTSMAQTADGPIAAYRDHQGEVRDISVVRFVKGAWTAPATVHADDWKINACPTNGPVLAAKDRRVAIGWFTAAGKVGRVRLAFSADAGATFAAPVQVDGGKPMGWPGLVMLEDGSAVVSWLESLTGGEGEVRLRRVWPDGRLGEVTVVSPARAGRSSGIPQLARAGNRLVVAWRADRVVTALVEVPTK